MEKIEKVDANYAGQIEGYRQLLTSFSQKVQGVCEMVNPEKLDLGPIEYATQIENINLAYQDNWNMAIKDMGTSVLARIKNSLRRQA